MLLLLCDEPLTMLLWVMMVVMTVVMIMIRRGGGPGGEPSHKLVQIVWRLAGQRWLPEIGSRPVDR